MRAHISILKNINTSEALTNGRVHGTYFGRFLQFTRCTMLSAFSANFCNLRDAPCTVLSACRGNSKSLIKSVRVHWSDRSLLCYLSRAMVQHISKTGGQPDSSCVMLKNMVRPNERTRSTKCSHNCCSLCYLYLVVWSTWSVLYTTRCIGRIIKSIIQIQIQIKRYRIIHIAATEPSVWLVVLG
jgi:hypothetical protein